MKKTQNFDINKIIDDPFIISFGLPKTGKTHKNAQIIDNMIEKKTITQENITLFVNAEADIHFWKNKYPLSTFHQEFYTAEIKRIMNEQRNTNIEK